MTNEEGRTTYSRLPQHVDFRLADDSRTETESSSSEHGFRAMFNPLQMPLHRMKISSFTCLTFNIFLFSQQDVHNQVFSMVLASGRWLGVRADFLVSVLVVSVAFGTVIFAEDAGKIVPLYNR